MYAHGDEPAPAAAATAAGRGRGRGRGAGGASGRGRDAAAPVTAAPAPAASGQRQRHSSKATQGKRRQGKRSGLLVFRDATFDEIEHDGDVSMALELYYELLEARLHEEEAGGPSPPAPSPGGDGKVDGGEEEDEPLGYMGPEERRARAASRARPPLPVEELRRRIGELEPQLLPDQLVTQKFRQLCWCQPCRRAFKAPACLLSHLQSQQHPPAGEAIARLQRERACPCGAEFGTFAKLSSHVSGTHGGPTRGQLMGEYRGDLFIARQRQFGPRYSYSDEEEGGGMCGFTADEVDELMCQGIKPWDDDAWEVMAVLRDF